MTALRALRTVLLGLALGWSVGTVTQGCQPAQYPGCDTADLDDAYTDATIAACWDFPGPLHECPGQPERAAAYESAVVARCSP